jgi:hypothetical protein
VITKAVAKVPLESPVKRCPGIFEYVAMRYYGSHEWVTAFVIGTRALLWEIHGHRKFIQHFRN